MTENSVADVSDAAGDDNVGQAETLIERRIVDTLDAAGNYYLGHASACVERLGSNAGNAAWNYYTGYVGIVIKRRIADASHCLAVDVGWNGHYAPSPCVTGDGKSIVSICRVSELGLHDVR